MGICLPGRHDNPYSFGEAITPENANYVDSGLGRTSEVGAYPANLWGLHDMHGNVWEWVEDGWHENYQSAPSDGSAWEAGGTTKTVVLSERRSNVHLCVLRGGAWGRSKRDCRSACRQRNDVNFEFNVVGFRVARTLS